MTDLFDRMDHVDCFADADLPSRGPDSARFEFAAERISRNPGSRVGEFFDRTGGKGFVGGSGGVRDGRNRG